MANIIVLFEVKPTREGMQRYLDLAAALKPLLAGFEGFIRAERFSSLNEEGKLLSMNVWTDEEAVARWRNVVEHRMSQREEFEAFNGPILFTTNCIVPPTANATYKDRVFTTNSTGFPDWKHIPADAHGKKDFSEIIALAKTCAAPKEIESGKIIGGFAHEQVFALADKVVDAVRSGAIRKFVVMGGCDGRMKNRQYYTDFAQKLPNDCVILTAGCAKYKYNKLALGDIGGIPRVLDAGQCNDSYSLALIALKLKEVFGLSDINDLPIVYNIAWYEQKAVIVLLALLSLGVKNIHLGPTLPGFLSPNVANVLVQNFGIGTISTVDEDLKAFGLV